MFRKQNSVPHEELDLERILSIDTDILSYGRFISGRILGSQLTLTNNSSKMRTFTVQVNSDSFKSSAYDMLKAYYSKDLPLQLKPDASLKNLYKYWQIEHPDSKQLLNKITIDLEAGES